MKGEENGEISHALQRPSVFVTNNMRMPDSFLSLSLATAA